jgi:hypothetical protein
MRQHVVALQIQTNTPPTFLHASEFQKYISTVSQGQFSAPSRYLHLQTVKELASRCHRRIETALSDAVAFIIEEDSWSNDGRKFSAVTAGVYAQCVLHIQYINNLIDCQLEVVSALFTRAK